MYLAESNANSFWQTTLYSRPQKKKNPTNKIPRRISISLSKITKLCMEKRYHMQEQKETINNRNQLTRKEHLL